MSTPRAPCIQVYILGCSSEHPALQEQGLCFPQSKGRAGCSCTGLITCCSLQLSHQTPGMLWDAPMARSGHTRTPPTGISARAQWRAELEPPHSLEAQLPQSVGLARWGRKQVNKEYLRKSLRNLNLFKATWVGCVLFFILPFLLPQCQWRSAESLLPGQVLEWRWCGAEPQSTHSGHTMWVRNKPF